MKHVTIEQQHQIINEFTNNLTPVITLAEQYNKSRMAIYKILKKHGVDPKQYGKISKPCPACNNPVTKHRSHHRKYNRTFCNMECYYAYIEGMQQGAYNHSRQGQRMARALISQNYFPQLSKEHIVHHEDRNTNNNHPKNLKVFASQADHVKYHRNEPNNKPKPIWDGNKI